MSKFRLFKSNSGFTLVEIIIATGLLAITTLASIQMTKTVRDSSRFGESSSELNSLAAIVRQNLQFRVTCANSLVGLNTSGFSQGTITNGNAEIRLLIPGIYGDATPGDDILAANISVKKLNIQSVHFSNGVKLGGGRYFSQVEMSVDDRISGTSLKNVSLGSIYFTAAGGAITSCDNPDLNGVPLCVEMGCVWDSTAIPMCQCPSIDLSCPPQQYITGIDALGKPICTALGGPACGAGTFLRGISLGTSDCAALPPASPPPPPPPPPIVVNGLCGAANGTSVATSPSTPTDLCTNGSPTAVLGSGPWNWSCLGAGGGSNMACSANLAASPIINGICGTANGTVRASSPSTSAELCSGGNSSAVSGIGPWDWTCVGSGGGTNMACNAALAGSPVNAVCGTANGTTVATAPSTSAELCSVGTGSAVSGTGPWNWGCTGSGGGTNASCTAATGGSCAAAPPNNAFNSICPTGTTWTACGTGANGCSGTVNPTDLTNPSPAIFRAGSCPAGYGNPLDVSSGSCTLTQCDRACIAPPPSCPWTAITTVGAPVARLHHHTYWTGSKLLVWGGSSLQGSPAVYGLKSGGLYDPATDSWTAIPDSPHKDGGVETVWTGTKLIAWGSYATPAETGEVYTLATNSWTTMSTVGAPIERTGHTIVWTGSRAIVWGGKDQRFGAPPVVAPLDSGGLYNPSTNSWSATSTVGAPSPRLHHAAIWTGSKMFIWGGRTAEDMSVATVLGDGAMYDPGTDSWTPISTTNSPTPRYSMHASWSGSKVIVWSGSGPSWATYLDGKIYDPATDTWTNMGAGGSMYNGYMARNFTSTGGTYYVHGGVGASSGQRYSLATNTWRNMGGCGAPDLYGADTSQLAAASAGKLMIWGGRPASSAWTPVQSGGIYDPALDP